MELYLLSNHFSIKLKITINLRDGGIALPHFTRLTSSVSKVSGRTVGVLMYKDYFTLEWSYFPGKKTKRTQIHMPATLQLRASGHLSLL